MSKKIIMPEMGEGVTEGTIVRWLKREGDTVKRDEAVLEIETDKVTVEVVAEADGTLLKINAEEGDTVAVGTVLAVIGEPGEEIKDEPVKQPKQKIAPTPVKNAVNGVPTPAAAKATTRNIEGTRVSPVVARMLQVHDIDVNDLNGSGRDGRITKKDVLAYLEETPEAPPVKVQAEPTPVTMDENDTLLPLSGMRRSIAEHMVKSKQISPHATTVFEFDFTRVAKHRSAHKEQFARDGAKLTFMPYIVQATVQALKNHPIVNASWSDDGIILKRDINLGIAVAVANGLIVPVIRHADSMNLLGLARAINDVSERARNNQLKPDEIRGGTFTVTNHGTSGSLIGTPIINQPQVGILGVGLIEKRLKVIDDAIMIRTCAYVSFSFDHRILDGASADAFIADIKHMIEDFS